MGERPVTLHYDDRDVNICYVVKKTGMRASSAKKAKEPEAPCMTLTIFSGIRIYECLTPCTKYAGVYLVTPSLPCVDVRYRSPNLVI